VTAPLRVVKLTLDAHLSRHALEGALAPVTRELEGTAKPAALVVDCLAMQSYDSDARTRFVEWNAGQRAVVKRVAIVTDKTAWRMVIATMALISKQEMRPFTSKNDAEQWAQTGQDSA